MSDDAKPVVVSEPDPSARAGLPPGAWKVIGVVVLAPFMTQMDSTIVNVALSSIRSELHASLAAAQWIVSGYLLALALTLPLNGWLVDRFGAKRLYLFCFTFFTATSFCCGAAQTMSQLIAARVLQGVAGGLLAPLTQLMMARVAGRQMARVFGYAAAPILIAPLVGPSLAGAILTYASWPWLFFVNVPIGIAAVTLAALILPRDAASSDRRPFDLAGFLLLSPGLSCSLYGFDQWAHGEGGRMVLSIGLLSIASFGALAIRKQDRALIDLRLFRIRTFSVAATTQFLSNGSIYAGQFILPLYLIAGVGLTPVRAGSILMTTGIGLICAAPMMGRLTDRHGLQVVAAGGVCLNLLGTLPFLWMARHQFSIELAMVGLFLRGLGAGATGIPSVTAAYASVPKAALSLATTAINIVQRLGGPILTTVMAVITSRALGSSTAAHPGAFQIPFLSLIVLQLLVLTSALQLPIRIDAEAR